MEDQIKKLNDKIELLEKDLSLVKSHIQTENCKLQWRNRTLFGWDVESAFYKAEEIGKLIKAKEFGSYYLQDIQKEITLQQNKLFDDAKAQFIAHLDKQLKLLNQPKKE